MLTFAVCETESHRRPSVCRGPVPRPCLITQQQQPVISCQWNADNREGGNLTAHYYFLFWDSQREHKQDMEEGVPVTDHSIKNPPFVSYSTTMCVSVWWWEHGAKPASETDLPVSSALILQVRRCPAAAQPERRSFIIIWAV